MNYKKTEQMDYEVRLIACCLVDNACIDIAISAGVRPEMFTNNVSREVWTTAVDRYAHGKSVDLVWTGNNVKTITGKLETEYTNATLNVLSPRSEAMSAVEIMKANYMRRQLFEILDFTKRHINVEDPGLLVNELTEKLAHFDYANGNGTNGNIEHKVVERFTAGIKCPTGFPQLDFLVKGFEPGVLWVIGGHTSNGKTTLVLNLAYKLIEKSQPVTFFSTEMDEVLLIGRIATMISGVNPSRLTSLTNGQKEAFNYGVHTAVEYPIEIHSTLSLSKIRMEVRKKKSALYIVDYIQMIDSGEKFENQTKELGYIVRELEKLAKQYSVCIIATSQFHRTKDESPTLSSFRGSGEIEENTDIGILLYYPYQQATSEEQQKIKAAGKDNIINLEVRKNRIHGLLGVVTFEFDHDSLRMKEYNKNK